MANGVDLFVPNVMSIAPLLLIIDYPSCRLDSVLQHAALHGLRHWYPALPHLRLLGPQWCVRHRCTSEVNIRVLFNLTLSRLKLQASKSLYCLQVTSSAQPAHQGDQS